MPGLRPSLDHLSEGAIQSPPGALFFALARQAALVEPATQMHNGHHCPSSLAAMWKSVFAIAIGAAAGALLRWFLGLRLNSLFPSLPPGTLAANLIGGYIIGVAVALFADMPALSPLWRLLIITGFCGGLTTFSTFSAEVVDLLRQGQLQPALAAIATHVSGSLLMTMAGIASWQWLKR